MSEKNYTLGICSIKINTQKKELLIAAVLLLIVIVQCVVLVYWQGQRGNYFVDELYSFGYGHAFTEETAHYVTEDEAWKYDTWMKAGDLQAQLEVSKDESLLSLSPLKAIGLLATKRTYMGLLNIVMSVTQPFRGYCYGAMFLNILFLLASELFLACIMRKMTGSYAIMLLSIIMFGFSAIIIGMCEYVRFYMMAVMILLLVILCHVQLWEKERLRSFFVWEMIALIAAYYGLKNAEVIFVTCGSFFSFFFLALLLRRKFRQAAVYAAPLLLGAYLFVYQQTSYFQILFHPAQFAQADSHGGAAVTYNLLTVTGERAGEVLQSIGDCLIEKWFGNLAVLIVYAALLVLCIILTIYKAVRREEPPADKVRYTGFAVVLALTAATGFTFNVLTYLTPDRYQVLSIVLLMIVFWWGAAAFHLKISDKRILIALAVITILGAGASQQADKFPFLYIEDKALMEQVEQYSNADQIVFEGFWEYQYNENIERHSFYESMMHCSENARIRITNPFEVTTLSEVDPGDQFIAWCVSDWGIDKMQHFVEDTDYKATCLGATYFNTVYLCSRER